MNCWAEVSRCSNWKLPELNRKSRTVISAIFPRQQRRNRINFGKYQNILELRKIEFYKNVYNSEIIVPTCDDISSLADVIQFISV